MQQILDRPLDQTLLRPKRPLPEAPNRTLAPCIARVVGIDARKRVTVRTTNAGGGVAVARLLQGIKRAELFGLTGEGREVLVVFEGGDPSRPIIVGLLESETEEAAATRTLNRKTESTELPQKRVLIEALAELVLKCGSGSITLREDGKIVLRGTHLLSRSSGPIRIKGGYVEIN